MTISALFALDGENWDKYLLNKQSMLHIALVSHSVHCKRQSFERNKVAEHFRAVAVRFLGAEDALSIFREALCANSLQYGASGESHGNIFSLGNF